MAEQDEKIRTMMDDYETALNIVSEQRNAALADAESARRECEWLRVGLKSIHREAGSRRGVHYCVADGHEWPCPTIRLLDEASGAALSVEAPEPEVKG